MARTGQCLYTRDPVEGSGECEGPVDFYACGERCTAHSPKKENAQ